MQSWNTPGGVRPAISAVLPAYNEEALIERAVLHLADALAVHSDDFEIIVTNDGSRDRTGAVLAALQEVRPDLPLRVVTHTGNQGYGAALASGFDTARKELIFFTDSDRQFDVTEIDRLLDHLDTGSDLVIGYRGHRADPPLRLLNALGWKLLVNGLFGYTARDVDCAFKLFRRRVWESMTVRSRGATFSAEFLIKARRLGFHVTEVQVTHFARKAGSPTGARPTVILRAFKELFALRRDLDRQLAEEARAAGSKLETTHSRKAA